MYKKITIILILVLVFSSISFAKVKQSDIPKNIKLIDQVISEDYFVQTVIDLDNNEIVLLVYNSISSMGLNLFQVKRTGWIVNPKDYPVLSNKK